MEKQIIIASRYMIIRKIGEGGMAKVYLAYDTKNEINVALKILKKENVNDKKIATFKREARTLSLLEDENIVKIFEVGEEGNIHYISTEYIEGMTLKEYIITCSPLRIDDVIEITRQILSGLTHAHERGVIHRDIKSQNIMLDVNRNVKITDFGISDVMDDDATRTQTLMGTPQYIAPELLNRSDLTEQSDIYSVGILMYEMLIGKAPFSGERPAIIMAKQMHHPLPSIILERTDVPQSLENVVIKATAKKLTNRYTSAVTMLLDLADALEDEMQNVDKLVLVNDTLSDEAPENTIVIDDSNLEELKIESEKIDRDKKRQKIIIIVIAAIIALVASFLIINNNKSIVMPKLTNLTVEEAKASLTLLGVEEEQIQVVYESSEEITADLIMSTVPEEGSDLIEGTPIVLTVSSGPEENILTDYTNELYENVKVELEELGYKVEKVEVDSQVAAGTIITQEPSAGTPILKGDTIIFTVSTGNYKIEVPNFSGLLKSDVESWADENGIQASYVYECNDTYAKDQIIAQEPAYNSEIENGGKISLTVSDGVCQDTTPEEETPTTEAATTPEENTTSDTTGSTND